jgi:hypothetical protein
MAGKYLCYGIIILIVLFCLELFEVVDVPFLELPDFISEKDSLIQKTTDGLNEIK